MIPVLPLNMGIPVGSVTAFAGYIGPSLSSSPDGSSLDASDIPKGFGVTIELQGWMVCDGRSLNCHEYPALFLTIGFLYNQKGDKYGPGAPLPTDDTGATFRLPDYRGHFLRMVSGQEPWPWPDPSNPNPEKVNPDPDADKRYLLYDPDTKTNGIGTVQDDALQIHHHGYYLAQSSLTAQPNAALVTPYTPPIPAPTGNTATTDPTDDKTDPTKPGNVRTSQETRSKNIYVYYLIKYA